MGLKMKNNFVYLLLALSLLQYSNVGYAFNPCHWIAQRLQRIKILNIPEGELPNEFIKISFLKENEDFFKEREWTWHSLPKWWSTSYRKINEQSYSISVRPNENFMSMWLGNASNFGEIKKNIQVIMHAMLLTHRQYGSFPNRVKAKTSGLNGVSVSVEFENKGLNLFKIIEENSKPNFSDITDSEQSQLKRWFDQSYDQKDNISQRRISYEELVPIL